ncbi:erythrocyte membrane protein 1 (PfEMP1) [Plasmodium falciparum NF54]|uniref:Erythrocyte membrane protein 1 (PfEMP1) n=1 Tax=Plasmodium falciparum (isolate NF54) TaxID=5843 RepID=A0A2I0BQ60_PLAFO|nr:erythrocyte membrane protein 1 (PfEMP1) [Plasmodium falciparum NF54]PKC42976.1 erythrocyte membrane protein 1 (PfEMP1) [Plasmodium falciparum NF54]
MGSQSSKSLEPIVDTNESYKSARNILEDIGKGIKDKVTKGAEKRGKSLKGNLSEAKFYHAYSKYRTVPESPCDLNYVFHTNVWHGNAEDRNPCLFSDKNRFSNESEAECYNSKITGNEGKIGACAPYRRRELCDYNLEHIDVNNVKSIHDLLGNLLVMARSEGESIVNSHKNTGMINVCASLARSFADIGDIVRGKDLFLGDNKERNKKLQGNLQKIFNTFQEHYKDLKKIPIDEIREYWWALNRKEVWKALTCSGFRV